MRVTLNIAQDAELRDSLKELIKGQVLGMVREEFRDIIREEVKRKLDNGNWHFNNLLEAAVLKASTNILYKDFNVGGWDKSFISPYINQRLDSVLKATDWFVLVDKLATEKLKAMLNPK